MCSMQRTFSCIMITNINKIEKICKSFVQQCHLNNQYFHFLKIKCFRNEPLISISFGENQRCKSQQRIWCFPINRPTEQKYHDSATGFPVVLIWRLSVTRVRSKTYSSTINQIGHISTTIHNWCIRHTSRVSI